MWEVFSLGWMGESYAVDGLRWSASRNFCVLAHGDLVFVDPERGQIQFEVVLIDEIASGNLDHRVEILRLEKVRHGEAAQVIERGEADQRPDDGEEPPAPARRGLILPGEPLFLFRG